MADRLRNQAEFKLINPSEYADILRKDPLWYMHPTVAPLIDEFTSSSKGKPKEWGEKKKEVIKMFAAFLRNEEIALGNEPEYFNDDDRWTEWTLEHFWKGKENTKIEKTFLDTVVVHHTATDPDVSDNYLNALGLLRLYVPLYRNPNAGFWRKGEPQSISSGHFYQGRQTFVGYHYLVRRDGMVMQSLKDEYTGFHAGHYPTNCRSIGIAIVDDLEEKAPTIDSILAVAKIIKKYNPEYVLGHRDVVVDKKTGRTVDTVCPGNLWTNWKSGIQK